MPFILAFIAAAFMALIICVIFVAAAGFALFMWIDIIIIAALIYYKQYLVLLIGIPLVMLIRTLQYRKKDLCAEICETFVKNYCSYVENEDDIKKENHETTGEKPVDDKPIEHDSSTTRQYAYVLWSKPHECQHQKTVCYSQSGKHKVTIQHTSWDNYLFLLTNYFTITREEISPEEHAQRINTTPIVITKRQPEEDTELFPKVITFAVMAVIYTFSFIYHCPIDIAIIAFFLFHKQYLALLIGISLITLIRTIQYRNVDIFAEACEGFVAGQRDSIQEDIPSAEHIEHLKKEDGHHVMMKQNSARVYAYVIPLKPHKCRHQATTFYSADQHYKITIQHSVWFQWLMYQHNNFTVTEELVNDNE